jgi:hypothetical protein
METIKDIKVLPTLPTLPTPSYLISHVGLSIEVLSSLASPEKFPRKFISSYLFYLSSVSLSSGVLSSVYLSSSSSSSTKSRSLIGDGVFSRESLLRGIHPL